MANLSFLSAVDTTTIIFIILLVVLIVALLVVPMFTNKKRAKQTEELHRSLQPGDVIKTVGGIIGTIKEIRQVSPVDKEMIIETGDGDNKTTMTFDIQALYQVMSRGGKTSVYNMNNEPAEEVVKETVKEEAPVVEEPKSEEVAESAPATESVEEQPATEQAAVEEPEAQEEKVVETKPMAPKSNTVAKKSNGAKKSTTKK